MFAERSSYFIGAIFHQRVNEVILSVRVVKERTRGGAKDWKSYFIYIYIILFIYIHIYIHTPIHDYLECSAIKERTRDGAKDWKCYIYFFFLLLFHSYIRMQLHELLSTCFIFVGIHLTISRPFSRYFRLFLISYCLNSVRFSSFFVSGFAPRIELCFSWVPHVPQVGGSVFFREAIMSYSCAA